MKEEVIMGDCLIEMQKIPDKSIEMMLTSPPYDNLRDYNGYTFDFEGIAKELYRVTKDGGVVVWVVGDATIKGSETGASFKQALYFKKIGFNLHDTMIYLKDQMAFPETNRYYQAFEYMFVFSKGKPKTVNLISDKQNKSFGRKVDKTGCRNTDGSLQKSKSGAGNSIKENGVRWNYWLFYNQQRGFNHPAVFPEKLAEDHILSWSNEGDTILDPMAGSGTTLKMAKKNNRNYIGIEISQEYIDIINKRLAPQGNNINK
jgi:DNA modification methylase